MPDSLPYYAGVLVSYFLRVAVAYAVFWLLSRLAPSPRRRFAMWLVFLLGAAGYWVLALLPTPLHQRVSMAVQYLPVHKAVLIPHTLVLPLSWASALTLIARVVAAAYLLGTLLFLANMLWQHFGLWRALRHAVEPSHDLTLLFEQMRRGLGLRHCRLQILPQLSSPATAGWLRPRILLPAICEDFSEGSQVADVLYHELMHVARRDYLWAAVSDLVRCLLYFHPAVWRARQHMRLQRELACDVAVVSGWPEHRADYAQSLTRFARLRMLQPGGPVGIDFAASASLLGMRVRAVLSHRPQLSWWRNGLRAGLSLALLACFGLLWPFLGIAGEFAHTSKAISPRALQVAAHVKPAGVHARVPRRHRPSPKQEALQPPRIAYQSPELMLLPPAATPPKPPTLMAMASSEFGPQSVDFDQAEQSSAGEAREPNWSETRPLHQSRVPVVVVIQRVATGLAQIGRAQMERVGREHGAR